MDASSNDRIYNSLDRIESKLDGALERIDKLESDSDRRAGARGAFMALAGLGAGTGLWAWLTDLFRHGGK